MGKKTINLMMLLDKYQGFAFKSKGAELCGFNKKSMECVVIEDGMCCSDDGAWLVHHYKINNNSYDLFSECKYPDGKKISEEWIDLT